MEEEMRRTLVYLEWKACWWESKVLVDTFNGAHLEGASAYAYEQADVWRRLGALFGELWERNKDGAFVMQTKKGTGGRAEAWDAQSRGQEVITPLVEAEEGESDSEDEAGNWEEVEIEEEEDNQEWGQLRGIDETEGCEEEVGMEVEEEELDLDSLFTAGKYADVHDY